MVNMTSKPVEILYRVFFDEMKFAKQQQWTVTNYMLLLLGAILGLSITLKTLSAAEKTAASFLVVGIVAAGYFFLIDLQFYLAKLRERIEAIENTFADEEKELLQVQRYLSPFRRGRSTSGCW